jgi:predicted DNA-binding transcriptional regulator AlpA
MKTTNLNKKKFIRETEAADSLGISVRHVQRMRVTGDGPRYFKFGRSVRYEVHDLESWTESCACKSTSQNWGAA